MKKTSLRRLLALALCAILILPAMTSPASAAEGSTIEDGTYTILADAAVPTAGIYRIGYDTVNGAAVTEGYVYLTCTAA